MKQKKDSTYINIPTPIPLKGIHLGKPIGIGPLGTDRGRLGKNAPLVEGVFFELDKMDSYSPRVWP